jgi:hypothetical protein
MLAFMRLLLRAILFLGKTPLFTDASMIGWAILKASVAAALSPEAIAADTFLMYVRTMERRLALCWRRVSAWRARLRDPAELATIRLLIS